MDRYGNGGGSSVNYALEPPLGIRTAPADLAQWTTVTRTVSAPAIVRLYVVLTPDSFGGCAGTPGNKHMALGVAASFSL
jgi:hypothetical protein